MNATRGDAVAMSYASRIAAAVSRIGYTATDPIGRPASASMQASRASMAWIDSGPRTFGTRIPSSVGPIAARRSFNVWPDAGGWTRTKRSGRATAGSIPSRKVRTPRRAASRADSGNGVRGSSRSITTESAPLAQARSRSAGWSPATNSTERSGGALPRSMASGRLGGEHLGRRLLAARALEEARVDARVEAHRVDERQLPELPRPEQPALDQLEGLR